MAKRGLSGSGGSGLTGLVAKFAKSADGPHGSKEEQLNINKAKASEPAADSASDSSSGSSRRSSASVLTSRISQDSGREGSESDVSSEESDGTGDMPSPPTFLAPVEAYWQASELSPHQFAPPNGREKYIIASACSGAGSANYVMQDFCELTETSFDEVVASERKPLLPFLARNYECEHLFDDCRSGHAGGPCYLHNQECQPRQVHRRNPEDIFVAGPPCTPFSYLNSRRKEEDYHPFASDPNSRPVLEICRHIKHRRPASFVLEEVLAFGEKWPRQCQGQFFDDYESPLDYLFDGILEGEEVLGLKEIGEPSYLIETVTVRSRDFGNPQCRQRIYIFGARSDLTSPAAMLQYFTTLKSVHGMCGVGDVVKWIAKLRKRCPDILHAVCKPKAQNRKEKQLSQKSQDLIAKWRGDIGMEPGAMPYTDELLPDQVSQLTKREMEVLNIMWSWVRAKNGNPEQQGYTIDLARSLSRASLSRFSKISALTTQNKLWFFPKHRLLSGEELLAMQGFDPRRFTFRGREQSYAFANRLAGNAMTTSVLAAAMFSLLTHVLPSHSGKPVIRASEVQSSRPLPEPSDSSSDSERETPETERSGSDSERSRSMA